MVALNMLHAPQAPQDLQHMLLPRRGQGSKTDSGIGLLLGLEEDVEILRATPPPAPRFPPRWRHTPPWEAHVKVASGRHRTTKGARTEEGPLNRGRDSWVARRTCPHTSNLRKRTATTMVTMSAWRSAHTVHAHKRDQNEHTGREQSRTSTLKARRGSACPARPRACLKCALGGRSQ